MEALRQPGPIAGFDKEGDVGLSERFVQVCKLESINFLEIRVAKHKIKVAGIVALAVDAAAVGPYIGFRNVLL